MDTNGAPSQASSNTPDPAHIRLACQACQRKKIKCDRHFPCGQCTRSNLQCVPSTRKPRARHSGKRAVDYELRNRISKLESLVESLSGEVGGGEGSPGSDGGGDGDGDEEPDQNISASVGKYMSSPFWSSLTTEVQALRDALEEQPDDEDDPTSPSTSSGPGNQQEYDLIVCPPGIIYAMPGALIEPTPELSATLCRIFCDNVDSLFKVFHKQTLQAFMINGENYLGHDHTAPANRLVKAAIWFAAVNTMSESQCQMFFGQSRGDQLVYFKRLVDIALAQADLMNVSDLASLQAFVTYIAAVRLTDTSRRSWTLLAVAVRVARAMGLHHESVQRTPFQTELRRRLWHQIRFLDIYTSLDRGSEQLITMGSFDTPIPKNTNDKDFNEASTSIPEHEAEFTDMFYSHLAYGASYTTQRLTTPDTKPGGDTWQQRVELAQKFKDNVQQKYLQYCDDSVPFQRFLKAVAGAMTASMFIRAVRPMAKHVSSVPPRVDSPYVLQIAINSLKASEDIQKDPETQQWRWMVWVGWHALAIALAGLCSIRDTELAKEAWVYVEQAYARGSRHVADTRNGMLWRPVEKLYKKASAFRDHGSTPSSISPPDMNNSNPTPPAQYPNQFGTTLGQPLPPITQTMPGSMPTSGLVNGPMDLGFGPTVGPMGDLMDFANSDMSWIDFQTILDDMNNPVATGSATEVKMPDISWPANEVAGSDGWNYSLHQNLM